MWVAIIRLIWLSNIFLKQHINYTILENFFILLIDCDKITADMFRRPSTVMF